MTETRRNALTLLTGALAASALAACGGKANRHPAHRGLLDVAALNQGFPALAARAAPGRFNIGVLSLAGDHVWEFDSEGAYPLADLFMLPVAAAALGEVDAGRLKLGEPITIRDVDLSPPPSLISAGFTGQTTMPAIDLIALAIQHGDNTAADVIMSRIGGPGAVAGWLQAKEIVGLRVDRYAREGRDQHARHAELSRGVAHPGRVRRGPRPRSARHARGGDPGLPCAIPRTPPPSPPP